MKILQELPREIEMMIEEYLSEKDYVSLALTSYPNYFKYWDHVGTYTYGLSTENFNQEEYTIPILFDQDFVIPTKIPDNLKRMSCKMGCLYKFSIDKMCEECFHNFKVLNQKQSLLSKDYWEEIEDDLYN